MPGRVSDPATHVHKKKMSARKRWLLLNIGMLLILASIPLLFHIF